MYQHNTKRPSNICMGLIDLSFAHISRITVSEHITQTSVRVNCCETHTPPCACPALVNTQAASCPYAKVDLIGLPLPNAHVRITLTVCLCITRVPHLESGGGIRNYTFSRAPWRGLYLARISLWTRGEQDLLHFRRQSSTSRNHEVSERSRPDAASGL